MWSGGESCRFRGVDPDFTMYIDNDVRVVVGALTLPSGNNLMQWQVDNPPLERVGFDKICFANPTKLPSWLFDIVPITGMQQQGIANMLSSMHADEWDRDFAEGLKALRKVAVDLFVASRAFELSGAGRELKTRIQDRARQTQKISDLDTRIAGLLPQVRKGNKAAMAAYGRSMEERAKLDEVFTNPASKEAAVYLYYNQMRQNLGSYRSLSTDPGPGIPALLRVIAPVELSEAVISKVMALFADGRVGQGPLGDLLSATWYYNKFKASGSCESRMRADYWERFKATLQRVKRDSLTLHQQKIYDFLFKESGQSVVVTTQTQNTGTGRGRRSGTRRTTPAAPAGPAKAPPAQRGNPEDDVVDPFGGG